MLVLAGYRAWGLTDAPLCPPGRWRGGAGRWSLGTLWRGYRQELWGTRKFRALWAVTAWIPPPPAAIWRLMSCLVQGWNRGWGSGTP